MTSFGRAREALGERLRELRRDARLTGRQLAESCGWPPSKISKIEGGKQTPTAHDIEMWSRECGSTHSAPDLIGALTTLESQYVTVRRKARAGMARGQRGYAELESAASFVRNFQCSVVPGLLQTADYARCRLAYWARYRRAEDELDAAVAARMARQQALYSATKFHFVIGESVLRHRVCPGDVMEGQLDRLMGVATMRSVHLGVIPFWRQYPGASPAHGFVIYDRARVKVETLTAELTLEEPSEIESYLGIFAGSPKQPSTALRRGLSSPEWCRSFPWISLAFSIVLVPALSRPRSEIVRKFLS